MSRLTGSEAKSLMEAYGAVYAPQQEEVVEEVVNEDCLAEAGEDLGAGLRQQFGKFRRGVGDVVGAATQGLAGKTTTSTNPLSRAYNLGARVASTPTRFGADVVKGFATGKGSTSQPSPQKPTSGDYKSPFAGSRDAAIKKAQSITGTPAVKPTTPVKSTPSSVSSGSKVSPSSSSAAPKPSGSAMQQWTANFPKLAAKVTPSGERAGTQMGTGQSTMSKQAAELRAMRERIASKPAPVMAQKEYDAYDLVLEYLLDNGHAQTVDEAHYLMIEMNAEMICDIVEAKYGTKEGRHKLAMKIKKGEEVGKSGPGTGFKAVEKAAKSGGARDPKAVAAAAMWKTYGGKKEE